MSLMAIACSRCGAEPGTPCTNPFGGALDYVHVERQAPLTKHTPLPEPVVVDGPTRALKGDLVCKVCHRRIEAGASMVAWLRPAMGGTQLARRQVWIHETCQP